MIDREWHCARPSKRPQIKHSSLTTPPKGVKFCCATNIKKCSESKRIWSRVLSGPHDEAFIVYSRSLPKGSAKRSNLNYIVPTPGHRNVLRHTSERIDPTILGITNDETF